MTRPAPALGRHEAETYPGTHERASGVFTSEVPGAGSRGDPVQPRRAQVVCLSRSRLTVFRAHLTYGNPSPLSI
jgi:hypothetical protein